MKLLVLALALAWIDGLDNGPPGYVKPQSSTEPRYIELLEENAHIVYPALAVVVVVLIAVGVIAAWRTEETDVIAKAELKREIIRELRRDLHGLTVDALARNIKTPSLTVLKLLEQMQEQGITESRTDTRRVTTWRLKGLTG